MLKKNLLLSIVFGMTLAACGGGGGSDSSVTTVTGDTGGAGDTPPSTVMPAEPVSTSITSLSFGAPQLVLPTVPDGTFSSITGLTATDDGGYRLFSQVFSSASELISQAFTADGVPVGAQVNGSSPLDPIDVTSFENSVIQSGDTLYHHFVQSNIGGIVDFSTFRGVADQDISFLRDDYFSFDESASLLTGLDLTSINGNQLLSVIVSVENAFSASGQPIETSDYTAFIISPNGLASLPINIASDVLGFGFQISSVGFDDSFGVVYRSTTTDVTDSAPQSNSLLFQRADFNGSLLGNPITIATGSDFLGVGEVVPLSDGTALIVWESESSQGADSSINARVVDESGNFVTEEIQVNDDVIGVTVEGPQVVPLANNQALIVWEEDIDQDDIETENIVGRIINADGTLSTAEIILIPNANEVSDGFGIQLDDGSIILAVDNMVLDITPVIGN